MPGRWTWHLAALMAACSPDAGAPGDACDQDRDCADGQPCRDGACAGCGDDRVDPEELCFGEPVVLDTLGADELHVLRSPGGPSLFATATRDPRLRRLHGADGPTLIEEWYLLENVPYSSIVGDFDADGWDDALVWTTFPVGAVEASFETGALRLGWSLSGTHPNAYMPGADGVPGRFFEVDPDALTVWTVGDPGPIEAPPLAVVGVQSVAVAEVDGDGRLDLVVSRVGRLDWLAQDGSDFVERGGGEIGFDADAVVSADLDADGRPELAVSRDFGVGFAIVRAGEDGALEVIWSNPDVSASPLAVADLDHDGRDDVLGVDGVTGVLRLVSLHAEGAWQERVIVAPEAEVARPFDVDGDGLLDVVIGENERLVILPGRG